MMEALATDADLKYLMVDGSTVPPKTEQDIEAMGKSRRGLSTKIHAAVDALGKPQSMVRLKH